MTCCDVENSCPGTPKRRRSVDNALPDAPRLNLSEEPVLIPLLEDLTIWLSGFLSTEISSENFIELFEDGVLFCKLAKILHEKALEYQTRTKHSYPLPSYSITKWYENPKVGSFFCRDNVCKFINWCKQFGVSEICLFESNDIVEHRTVRALRNVLICVLEVGRIGVKHGIEPSELVRIELEIEREIQEEIAKQTQVPRQKSRIPRKNSSLNSSLASSSEPPTSEEEEEEEASSPEPDEEELERIRLKLLSLDAQVRAIVSRCTCKTPFQLDRVGDGKYKLPNTSQIFFVRILRNHVMVRVGGGWDTLDHFIAKHDPCRMKFKQITGEGSYSPGTPSSARASPASQKKLMSPRSPAPIDKLQRSPSGSSLRSPSPRSAHAMRQSPVSTPKLGKAKQRPVEGNTKLPRPATTRSKLPQPKSRQS